MRILLVEDDEILADALYRTLVQSAYAVDLANNGAAELREKKARHYTCSVRRFVREYWLDDFSWSDICSRLVSVGGVTGPCRKRN